MQTTPIFEPFNDSKGRGVQKSMFIKHRSYLSPLILPTQYSIVIFFLLRILLIILIAVTTAKSIVINIKKASIILAEIIQKSLNSAVKHGNPTELPDTWRPVQGA